jgi:hypothetical protein
MPGGPAGSNEVQIRIPKKEPPERLNPARKIVFVLGAGFSRALGGPLMNNLLDEMSIDVIHELFPRPPEHVDDWLAHGMYQARRVCQGGIQTGLWLNAEDFLEKLESAYLQQPDAPQAVASHSLISTIVRRGVAHRSRLTGVLDTASLSPLEELVRSARRAIAADCSVFNRGADPEKQERWWPFLRWARGLQSHHTVLTFNYDTIPDVLEKQKNTALDDHSQRRATMGSNREARQAGR